jgi:hypothetical protein
MNFTWKQAFVQKRFRLKVFFGLLTLLVLLSSLPYFFGVIEKRNGLVLNDWALNWLPAKNVSIPIFTLIWSMVAITLYECYKNPTIFLQLLWAFIFLTITRIISISLVPLNSPPNLVVLVDPLSNYFYGQDFITKDLFFSGHTSTQFLLFFVLQKAWQKRLAFLSAIFIGVLVLVQHVHYTIDVLGAFAITPLVYRASKLVSSLSINEAYSNN